MGTVCHWKHIGRN